MLFGNKIHLIIEVARNINLKLLLIYYAIIQLHVHVRTVQQVSLADIFIFLKVSIILVSLYKLHLSL